MIRTARLQLREFSEADVDPLYAIQGDRQHMRHTFWAESRDACAVWLRRYASSRETNGFAPWTVLHASTIVGWGGLSVDPHVPGWGPEVVYLIHPSYEGCGFATEVVQASGAITSSCGARTGGPRMDESFTATERALIDLWERHMRCEFVERDAPQPSPRCRPRTT